jgi:RNA polymerase sigma-70 factor (ECF subfamily)
LATALADASRRYSQAVIERERSIERSVEESSQELERWLSDSKETLGQRLVHRERLVKLAEAILQLPEDQRLAVELRHLHGLPVAEIGRRMSRSVAAVGGLLQRGLKGLCSMLDESSRNVHE